MMQLTTYVKRRRSLRWLWMQVKRHQQFSMALTLLGVVVVLHTLLFYFFEHVKNAKLTLFDSFWVTITTLTTVGYGDISASTVGGRWSTILLGYVIGLSLFAWVGSEVVSRLFERMLNRRRGMGKRRKLENHYLIVNFPGEEKVRLLVERLRENEATSLTPLVVIADNIDMLPFEYADVHFIRGSITNPNTYKRANIDRADKAIVLAVDHEDPGSDAITAAAVSIIESLNSDINTVAECVFEEHLTLFRHVNCDQILLAGDMLIRLLIQETQDVGAARAISRLLDPSGNELYSIPVGEHGDEHTFRDIMWNLMTSDTQVMAIGFRREQEVTLNPPKDVKLQADDDLIVLCDKRPDWEALPKSIFGKG